MDGRPVRAATAILPPLPAGRYAVRLASRPEEVCQLTVAPRRCYHPACAGRRRTHVRRGRRISIRCGGKATRASAISPRSAISWRSRAPNGSGDVGINPLHALFAAIASARARTIPRDRRFLDPIYLDIARLGRRSQWRASRQDADAIKTLTKLRAIDYPGAWAIKRAALEHAFLSFEALAKASPRHPEILAFESFLGERGEALTRFPVPAIRKSPGSVANWPANLQDEFARLAVERPAGAGPVPLVLQWLCDRQIGARRPRGARGRPVAGALLRPCRRAAPDGAEIWAARGDFARGVSIGAPPDLFSPKGRSGPCRRPIRSCRHARAARPSARSRGQYAPCRCAARRPRHGPDAAVLGARRCARQRRRVCRGADGPPDGATRFGEHAGRVAVIGEDLGTVPDGFRERLAAADVLSYRVLWFEREGPPSSAPEQWPRKGGGLCFDARPADAGRLSRGADIAEKLALGLMAPQAAGEARDERRAEKRLLLSVLQEQGRSLTRGGRMQGTWTLPSTRRCWPRSTPISPPRPARWFSRNWTISRERRTP